MKSCINVTEIQMKKIVFITLIAAVFSLTLLKVDFQRFSKPGCPFCDKEILERQVFYRGSGALGILTHKPAVPGHVLIIPERHVERFEDLTADEVAAIGDTIKRVDIAVRKTFGYTDYVLIQKNGPGAGQSVPHVHFHYLPATKFFAIRFFISPWLKPLTNEETRRTLHKLLEEFNPSFPVQASARA
jgi:histidine triad (HIT) family protein